MHPFHSKPPPPPAATIYCKCQFLYSNVHSRLIYCIFVTPTVSSHIVGRKQMKEITMLQGEGSPEKYV